MAEMMECPNCGSEIRRGFPVCTHCHREVEPKHFTPGQVTALVVSLLAVVVAFWQGWLAYENQRLTVATNEQMQQAKQVATNALEQSKFILNQANNQGAILASQQVTRDFDDWFDCWINKEEHCDFALELYGITLRDLAIELNEKYPVASLSDETNVILCNQAHAT